MNWSRASPDICKLAYCTSITITVSHDNCQLALAASDLIQALTLIIAIFGF